MSKENDTHLGVSIVSVRQDLKSNNFVVRLRRPDGVEVSVAIPDGNDDETEKVVLEHSDDAYPFGLNMVCGGHYT